MNDNEIGFDELLNYLIDVDHDFDPPLSLRVDLEVYARKLNKYALLIFRKQNNKVIAFLGCYCNREVAFLSIISVKGEFTKQGYFKDLMNELINHLVSIGVQKMELEVNRNNEIAYKAYLNMGFKLRDPSSTPNHDILILQI